MENNKGKPLKMKLFISVENTNNILPLSTQTVSYNDFGKVENITDGNYTMSFVYGPDLERWKTELRNGQNVTCTTLYGDGYERIIENGTTRHFYYLEGGVLCVKQDGQPDQFYYMNTDHQGSILSIVDANGSNVFEADYDAWGKQTVTLNTIGFHRGYTGHEMLPEFGLINMNGRLYNPDLGRFLSPDNFVQAPDFSQNFNRYSYCLNNPLKYTDPSGEFFAPILFGAFIGAAIAGTTYTLSTLMTGQHWNSHNFWKSVGVGAFSGALAGGISVAGSALGISTATTNTIGYKLMSQVSNTVITNAIFGNDFSGADLLGVVAGAALASQLPGYVAKEGSALKNFIGETLHNTANGAISGIAQGAVKASLEGDIKYLPQGIVGGAIGGLSKTLAVNAIFGAPYIPKSNVFNKVVFRKGGLGGFYNRVEDKINHYENVGAGLTLGKNIWVYDNYTENAGSCSLLCHEHTHFLQIETMGWLGMYANLLYNYVKYWDITAGPLEDDAYFVQRMVYNMVKKY